MRIVSWNVNGLRSAHKKGFLDWLAAEKADVVGVQEVRARAEQLPEEVSNHKGLLYNHFVAAELHGYIFVGLFARKGLEDV